MRLTHLSVGHRDNSMTNNANSHYPDFKFSPVILATAEAANVWAFLMIFILDWFCQRNTKPCRSRERSDLFMFMPLISFQRQEKGGLNLHMYKNIVFVFLHEEEEEKMLGRKNRGTNKDVLSYPARCFSFLSSMPSLDTSLLNTKIPITMLTCQ